MRPAVHTRPAPVRAKDYGYCNARVRGMNSHLLDRQALEQLIAATDLEMQIRLLSGTPYKPELEDALLHGHTVASVDRALRANMAREFNTVLQVLPEKGVGLVKAVLAQWDVFDLKTILRGVHAGSSSGEILESLMPAATLTSSEFEELAKAESVREFVDILGTWRSPYARPLEDALAEYRERGDVAPLELALDRWYFASVAERLRKVRGPNARLVRKIMGTMVDIENLRTAFRIVGASLADDVIASYWLRGGQSVDMDTFVHLGRATDIDDIVSAMRRTPYANALEQAAADYLKEGTISSLERALEDMLARKVIASKRVDPLGVGVVLAFLWAKQNEVSNIRIAVTGRAAGLPEDRMRKELILV